MLLPKKYPGPQTDKLDAVMHDRGLFLATRRARDVEQTNLATAALGRLGLMDALARAESAAYMNGLEIRQREAARWLTKWCREPLAMERPTDSAMRDFLMAEPIGNKVASVEIHALVVEHDWAAFVGQSPEFREGDWRPPYPATCFEFQIKGARVCALVVDCDEPDLAEQRPVMHLGVRVPRSAGIDGHGWVFDQDGQFLNRNGTWSSIKNHIPGEDRKRRPMLALLDLVARQIKATSIVLDAQVATTAPIREAYRRNTPPADRSTPLPSYSFHVVNLKPRANRLPAADDGHTPGERRRHRLHFVRGHWRHFDQHRTWVHWHLRGDQDLGFVDKEYRL
jgi:hypothetical protein